MATHCHLAGGNQAPGRTPGGGDAGTVWRKTLPGGLSWRRMGNTLNRRRGKKLILVEVASLRRSHLGGLRRDRDGEEHCRPQNQADRNQPSHTPPFKDSPHSSRLCPMTAPHDSIPCGGPRSAPRCIVAPAPKPFDEAPAGHRGRA